MSNPAKGKITLHESVEKFDSKSLIQKLEAKKVNCAARSDNHGHFPHYFSKTHARNRKGIINPFKEELSVCCYSEKT
ncbi:hypothetical protein WN48_02779 [Eufriesea mexicana]|uniref:Uncharacterized protein n=1 Tax=Eufriesea mexicana TaxID=516756 RepID=A0A310SBG9_9HYME|nr:hypothetical protein WN48_02779 [Eufriesea mexicana]